MVFQEFCTVFASHGEPEQKAGEQHESAIPTHGKNRREDGCKQSGEILQIVGINEYIGYDGKGKQCWEHFFIPQHKTVPGCGDGIARTQQYITDKYDKT